jgi:hypothetical protein
MPIASDNGSINFSDRNCTFHPGGDGFNTNIEDTSTRDGRKLLRAQHRQQLCARPRRRRFNGFVRRQQQHRCNDNSCRGAPNSNTSTSNTFRAADISHKHEHSATHSPFYAARGRSNTRRANEGLESGLTEDGQGRDSPRRPSASLRDRVLPIGLTSVISKPTPGQVQGQGPNKTVRLRSKALYPYVSNWIYSNQKSARA